MHKIIMILIAILSTPTLVFSQELSRTDFALLTQSKITTSSLLDRIEKLEKSLDKPQNMWYAWAYRDAAKLCLETGKPFIICKGYDCKNINEICRKYGEQGKKVVCVDEDPYYDDIPDGEHEVIKVNGELQYSRPVYKKTHFSTTIYRQPVFQYNIPMYQGVSCGPSG